MNVTIRPQYDNFGTEWLASLRVTEHDSEFDGFRTLNDGPLKTTDSHSKLNESQDSPLQRRSALADLSKQPVGSGKAKLTGPFLKRRRQFEKEFISEEDLPLDSRRLILSHNLGYSTSESQMPATRFRPNHATNMHTCTFHFQKRLPNVVQQFVVKPDAFKSRNFMSKTKSVMRSKHDSLL